MNKLLMICILIIFMGGCARPKGDTGNTGDSGSQGNPGLAGTVVLPIKFCPNDTPVYPTVFPEVGFCIEHKLYAVYSTHGGFLTEVVPGTYNSSVVGSACNFTVSVDCVVTH